MDNVDGDIRGPAFAIFCGVDVLGSGDIGLERQRVPFEAHGVPKTAASAFADGVQMYPAGQAAGTGFCLIGTQVYPAGH